MREVDLARVDLNLLVSLEILLEERHVSKSANRLNLSQSAMSRTLARLRETFDDPLIVRGENGYERTARGEELALHLTETLDRVGGTFSKTTFDPKTATGSFRISTLDYAEVVLLPEFVRVIRREAPNLEIDIIRRSVFSLEEVNSGAADISVGMISETAPKQYMQQKLFNDRYVCVMHESHPLASQELTLDAYLSYPHSIIHSGASPGSIIDDYLAKLGHRRKIARRSPSFLAAVISIGDTDLLHATPLRLAKNLQPYVNLVVRELPFEMELLQYKQIWHARNNSNPSHLWLRNQLAASAKHMQKLIDL